MNGQLTAEDILGGSPAPFEYKTGENAQLKSAKKQLTAEDILSAGAYEPPVQEAPITQETLSRKVLDALLPPTPEDVANANRPNYTAEGLRGYLEEHLLKPSETIGGLVREKTSGLNEPTLTPVMGAAESLAGSGMTAPVLDEVSQWLNKKGLNPQGSTAAQFVSGIPGALAEAGGEFAGSLIADAPAQVALGGIGEGMQATNAFRKTADALERVAPWAVYRGGQLPASKAAGEALDKGKLMIGEDTSKIIEKMLVSPQGKALNRADVDLITGLMEEPGIRELLGGLPETPVAPAMARPFGNIGPVPGKGVSMGEPGLAPTANVIPAFLKNRIKKLYKENEIPGLTKINSMPPSVVQAMQEELTMPPVEHAKVAEELSKVFYANNIEGATKKGLLQQMAEISDSDPDTFSRYTNNYLPQVRGRVVEMAADEGVGTPVMPNNVTRPRGTKVDRSFLKKRADQTEESRINAGFLPPEQSVAIRFMQERNLINNLNYFNTLAKDPMVVRPVSSFPELQSGGNIALKGWTKMPNEKAYGPLQGMMVRTPEANDIMAAQKFTMKAPQTMRKWWSMWKFGKTVMSPKTWIRNNVSNAMLAHGAGLSPWRMDIYGEAGRELSKGGKWLDEAKAAGHEWAFGGTRRSSQIGEMYNLANSSNIYEAGLTSIPDKVMNSKGLKALGDAYQDTERFFKHAVYIYLRRNGMSIDDAGRQASFGIINYDKMPWWVKDVRSNPLGVPFISYTYGSIGPLSKALMEKPQIYAQYKIVIDAWNRMAAEAINAKQEDVDMMEQYTGGMMPVFTPARDSTAGIMVTDISPAVPFGNLVPGRRSIGMGEMMRARFGDNLGAKALGGLAGMAESTALSNPILNEFVAQVSGVDPYYKSQFADPLLGSILQDTRAIGQGEAVDKYAPAIVTENDRARILHFLRTTAPEILGGGFTQNMYEAIKGKENFLGDKVTPGGTLANFLSPTGTARSLKGLKTSAGMGAMKFTPAVVKSLKKMAIREKGRNKKQLTAEDILQ